MKPNAKDKKVVSAKPKDRDFCGCCGREIAPPIKNYSSDWCVPCQMHLGPPHLAPWDRAYSAQHPGEECPHQEPLPGGRFGDGDYL